MMAGGMLPFAIQLRRNRRDLGCRKFARPPLDFLLMLGQSEVHLSSIDREVSAHGEAGSESSNSSQTPARVPRPIRAARRTSLKNTCAVMKASPLAVWRS